MTYKLRQNPFQITRNGFPIESYALRDTVSPGIAFSQYFEIWDALINCNATIEEQLKYWHGEYDKEFLASILAVDRGRRYVSQHMQDAVNRKMAKKNK